MLIKPLEHNKVIMEQGNTHKLNPSVRTANFVWVNIKIKAKTHNGGKHKWNWNSVHYSNDALK